MSPVRSLAVATVLVTLVTLSTMTEAVTVKLEGDTEDIQGKPVYIDRSFAGLVGDTVDLGTGKHRFSITPRKGYELLIDVVVDDTGKVTTENASVRGPFGLGCVKVWNVSWAPPVVKGSNRQYAIRLFNPEFVDTGQERCVAAMMLSCQKDRAVLTVQSDPVGAEIWLNDEKTDQLTNAVLSVPDLPPVVWTPS